MSRIPWLCIALACAVTCFASLNVARTSSATSDEVVHLPAGVSYLHGDLRLNREHPPLIKVLAAAFVPNRDPPLWPPTQLPAGDFQWSYGAAWLHGARQPPLDLLFAARLPLLLLNACLVVLVALFAHALAGPVAGVAAASMLALCPLWLAHATLVTTDATATLWFFASVYAAWQLRDAIRYTRLPLRPALALAASLALALATKYSMLALTVFVPLAAALDAWRERGPRTLAWTLAATLVGTLLGVGCAWGLPPRPDIYLDGLLKVGGNHLRDYPFYAFGEFFFQDRKPLYFMEALLVKVSVPVWLLVALAPLARARGALLLPERFSWQLCVAPLGYLALMSAKAPALGVRYVLPVLPFLILLAACTAAWLFAHAKLRFLLFPLALVQLAGFLLALSSSPLAFFNGLGCSTGDSLPCLDDSNVDWGQALPALARFRDRHYPHVAIRIFYFGSSQPQAYVPGAVVARPEEAALPMPALYAVSLHIRTRTRPESWIRQHEPSAIVGGAYAIYDLRAPGAK